MATNSNLPTSSRVFQLLYAFDIDGRTNKEISSYPIAVLTGTDEKPIPSSLYNAVLKKHIARGDSSRYESVVDLIDRELNESYGGEDSWDTDEDVTVTIDSEFFTRQRLEVPESILAECYGNAFPKNLILRERRDNDYSAGYEVVSSEDDVLNCEAVPVVDAASETSPFIEPSPFVVKDGYMYLADKEGNAIGEPYIKVIDAFGPFMVMRKTGAGIVSKTGEELTPCIYERISLEPGGPISFDLDGLTGFYEPRLGILCPPRFKDIDFGDGEDPIRVLTDAGWGYLDEDLNFHSDEAFENGDCDDLLLL